ncbi:MAG TPA: MASE1 domain-containing protein [Candidatus Sulfotelmatobacter sp.]|jgi:PAS domain S-box-containing protein|nr:MASE1 domain-containing protein [Candidatus Sulfotelmatobacter sp.]
MNKRVVDNFLPHSVLRTVVLNICIFLVYVISGKVGLSFASLNPSATAIWPPTGIALAAFLLFGYRVIPAIFLGAFFVNLTTAGTLATSLGIALGNSFEGIVGAYLVNRFANGIHTFSNVSNIFKFFFFAIISTTISADIGVATLLFGNLVSWKELIVVWITWWLGDMGGSLIITPLILVWGTSLRGNLSFRDTVHILLAFFVLCVTTWLVFSGILPYPYLCIPIAVWIAFWFGRRGATTATIIVACIAIFYTIHGLGPFTNVNSLSRALILMQLFLGILTLTSLTFAALIHTIRQGEKTLAFHEARFKALIEKSFDAVVLIDATSKILYASPSVKRVLGYDIEEIIGINGFELVYPKDRPFTIRILAKLALKPGATITVEYRVIKKDKSVIWVEATGTNLLFDQFINAVVINFRDITEKKNLEETMLQEKIEDEAMLASIGDGIIATDNIGRIKMINQSACDTLGWKRKELIGKVITTVIPMEDELGKPVPIENRPMTKVLSLRKKIVTSRIYYYVKKDKSTFPVRFTVTPITIDNNIVGIIEVFHDITREKEIDQMKDEFIAMASHELRTPMTAIKGLLSMIFHGDYGPINKKLERPLDNIQISAKRQIYLINDLLNVSRLQSGKIEFKLTDFSLRSAIEDVIKSLMPIAQEKQLSLQLQNTEEIMTHADIEWSKNILNNLIGNALKFTDKGGITLSYHTNNTLVSIAVTDTGRGIDAIDQEKLFGKFQQLRGQMSSKLPGSGLGLFLSRELARKMGGDVQLAQSKTNKGSTFIFTLPKTQISTSYAQKTTTINKKKIAISSQTS